MNIEIFKAKLPGGGNNFLKFIYEKLLYVKGERENLDFMIKLKEIVDYLDKELIDFDTNPPLLTIEEEAEKEYPKDSIFEQDGEYPRNRRIFIAGAKSESARNYWFNQFKNKVSL